MNLLPVGCLVLAALAMTWPGPGRRARCRRILAPVGSRPRGAMPSLLGRLSLLSGLQVGRLPVALLLVAGVVLAAALGGAVAGVVAAGYGAVGARTAFRRGAARTRTARRTEVLDLLGSAAADLRAGLPADTALAGLHAVTDDPIAPRVRAAVVLADQTGAPLADVLERIEADARSTDRARLAGAAQAAGSRATAWLLAALPAAGIALGYAIGADPLAVLLHTPIGAACALGALALQLAGLGWAGRLTRPVEAVAS